jgi:hypothetical protein
MTTTTTTGRLAPEALTSARQAARQATIRARKDVTPETFGGRKSVAFNWQGSPEVKAAQLVRWQREANVSFDVAMRELNRRVLKGGTAERKARLTAELAGVTLDS